MRGLSNKKEIMWYVFKGSEIQEYDSNRYCVDCSGDYGGAALTIRPQQRHSSYVRASRLDHCSHIGLGREP